MGIGEIFTNREIAIGIVLLLVICMAFLKKPFRDCLSSTKKILLCRKFLYFYMIFIGYFIAIIFLLSWIGFWTYDLLKDTIFWILFIEFPLFANAIQKARNYHFFAKLLKSNFQLVIVFEFFLNYWAFSLLIEFFIVFLAFIAIMIYALIQSDKKYIKVKKIFDICSIIFGLIIICNSLLNFIYHHNEILTIVALKQLLLPVVLLLFNLPLIYGLVLYSVYEEVFIRIRGKGYEKLKMKISIIKFAGLHLDKITLIRNNLGSVTAVCLNNRDLIAKLNKLNGKLFVKVGENYMKRSNFYMFCGLMGFIVSIFGIILCNFEFNIKELNILSNISNFERIREIATYIFSTATVTSIFFLIYSIGLAKQKYEDISQVKKFALHELVFLVKRQHGLFQEFIPIDKPATLFSQYVINAYEIYIVTDKNIELFENLLKDWEIEEIKALNTSALIVVNAIGIQTNDIHKYTTDSFNAYFQDKKVKSQQNENINIFTYEVEKSIKKYTTQIKRFHADFKSYYIKPITIT